MVEVIKKGAYLVDGQIVYADQAQNVAAPDEAREKTIAYSILRAHNKGKDPKKMQIKFDALISHDITFVGIIQTAMASGLWSTHRKRRPRFAAATAVVPLPQNRSHTRSPSCEEQLMMRSSSLTGFCVSYPVRWGSFCCRWLTSSHTSPG